MWTSNCQVAFEKVNDQPGNVAAKALDPVSNRNAKYEGVF